MPDHGIFRVTHLEEHWRAVPGDKYEVQLLDPRWETIAYDAFAEDAGAVSIGGVDVPAAVLEAAKRLKVGETEVVDETGTPTFPGAGPPDIHVSGRYFVMHLENEGSASTKYEIHLVNKHGQATAVARIGESETQLRIEDVDIPLKVIEAARRQPEGKGDYVDDFGNSVSPLARR